MARTLIALQHPLSGCSELRVQVVALPGVVGLYFFNPTAAAVVLLRNFCKQAAPPEPAGNLLVAFKVLWCLNKALMQEAQCN